MVSGSKARPMLRGPDDLDPVWALSQVVKNAGILQQTPNGHCFALSLPTSRWLRWRSGSSAKAMVTLNQGSSQGSSLDPHCTSRGCQDALTQTAHGSLPSPSLVRDHCPLWGQTLGKSFVGPRGHDGMAGPHVIAVINVTIGTRNNRSAILLTLGSKGQEIPGSPAVPEQSQCQPAWLSPARAPGLPC